MVYRYSWIAGIAAIGLAFWELSSLLRDSVTGTPWQVAILIAALLGAGITWTALAYRASAWIVILANTAAFVILAGLIVAPETLFIVFPTTETWSVVSVELSRALEIIQHGVEPVRPVPGLILLISLLFWTLGFLLIAGLFNDRPFVAILTPLIVAVQFAIIDRKPKSLSHLAVFILVVAFSLIAIRADERDRGTGRLQRVNATRAPTRRPTPAIGVLISATILVALFAVGVIGNAVPSDGFVTWRSPSGYSDSYAGSTSYNPFVDIKAGLIHQTDNPLFQANIRGVDPSTVRFRTVTLDVYRNGRWSTDRIHAFPIDEEPWIDSTQQYRGPTNEMTAEITIQNLGQPWMPAPATPSAALASTDGDTKTIRVRRLDGSLSFQEPMYEGMQYTVRADIPTYTPEVLSQLIRTESGELSPLFETAEAAGETIPRLGQENEPIELVDNDFWIEVPDDLGSGVLTLARTRTKNMTTNFEKALALEHYFRLSGEFVYDTAVPNEYITGDVSDWLTDSANPYARHGYCEQFATAMALMGRSVGVPSRVVLGFTPGDTLNDTVVQVKDKNAHAWVEMWIPTYGWMAFDPTPRSGYAAVTADESLTALLDFSPSQYLLAIPSPAIINDSGGGIGPDEGRFLGREESDSEFVPGAGGSDTGATGIDLPAWATWLVAVVALIAAFALMLPITKWWRRRRKLARLKAGDISAAWEDIVDRLTDLGDPVKASATPLEAARAVDEAFEPLARTYARSLYGERASTTAVIDEATNAHRRAVQHVATRYSTFERVVAVFRPSRLMKKMSALLGRRNGSR
jgi:transglutaminase-like putative cysteine protease